jgi:hypothetical protein
MSIENIYAGLELARSSWREALELLSRGQWDFAAKKSVLDLLSLDEYDKRVLTLLEIFDSIRPSDPTQLAWVAMFSKHAEITERLAHFTAHAKSVADQLRPNMREGVELKDANNKFTVQFFEAGAVFNTWDAGPTFREMSNAIQPLVQQAASLLPLCKADALADLSVRAKALSDMTREAEAARTETRKFANASDKAATAAAEKAKSAEDSLSQAQTSYSKIQAVQTAAQQEAAAVTTLVQQIKTTGASADTLEQQIAGYKSKFEAFQIQLDARLSQFAEFETDTKAAAEANQKRGEEVDRIIDASDKMITGATTAGLADSMEKTRARYEERMKGAKVGFYVAVAMLVVSTLPLIVHLLPGIFGPLIPVLDPKAASDPFAILGKVILMVPATWLTVFFNKSYSEFFHLEREYAHKAALAMSVDGFKRQAKKYEEEIAAEVFMEIRSNPGNRPSPEPAAHPLYDILGKKVFEYVSKEKKGDGK